MLEPIAYGGTKTSQSPRSTRLVTGGLTLALVLAVSMGLAGSAAAKAPSHAFYAVTDTDCFTKTSATGHTTLGAKVDAYIGVRPKKNNALRRLEIKYRLVYADTSAGLGWSKPGYKVSKSATKEWSDKLTWKWQKKDLKTNRENLGGDYHVEVQFVWIRAGVRPNWKVTKVYTMDESTCSGGTW